MTNSVKIYVLQLIVALALLESCGEYILPSHTYTYTTRDEASLEMDVFVGDSNQCANTSLDTLSVQKPAILYFHGGSWISGTRDKIHQCYREHVLRWLLDKGFAVFSVDYRLIGLGRGHLESCVDDCRDALSYVIDNADTLGVDTTRIGLWGSSAGAHLAMMTVFADSLTARRVKFLVDDFGPVDIHNMFHVVPEWGRVLVADMVFDNEEKSFEQYDSLTLAYSPISYDTNIPLLIFHGEDDGVVDISQSRMLHQKFSSNSHFITFPENGHGLKNLDSLQLRTYVQNFENFVDSILW